MERVPERGIKRKEPSAFKNKIESNKKKGYVNKERSDVNKVPMTESDNPSKIQDQILKAAELADHIKRMSPASQRQNNDNHSHNL
ncbi:hypothetical protein E1H99_07660 [Enterococcus hirae]|nr:hypothetical protein E1H99_07660 [Enterococcus hirae]